MVLITRTTHPPHQKITSEEADLDEIPHHCHLLVKQITSTGGKDEFERNRFVV